MTPELWAAIAFCLTGLGGTVKWAVTRWEAGQKAVAHELFETRVLIAALLERERIRDVRRKRESSQPPLRDRRGFIQAVPVEIHGETTDIITLCDEQRKILNEQRHVRAPRKGTHHDTED